MVKFQAACVQMNADADVKKNVARAVELVRDAAGQGAQFIALPENFSLMPGNAKELMACPDIDGALVGGASLKADSFGDIVKASLAKPVGVGPCDRLQEWPTHQEMPHTCSSPFWQH